MKLERCDAILHNGVIISVDKDFSIAQAVAITGNRIVKVGTNKEVLSLAGSETTKIDLKGQAVIPGAIDSHTHAVYLGENLLRSIQLSHVKKLSEILDSVAGAVKETGKSEWIVSAHNWRHHDVDRLPTAEALDSVAPNNPVWIRTGGHRGFANTMALHLAGITKDTVPPIGGKILKDPTTGELTGELEETAQKAVEDLLPKVDLREALRKACLYYNSIGVTAIQNDGVSPEELEAYMKVKASGELNIRSTLLQWFYPSQTKEELFAQIHALAGAGFGEYGDDSLKVVGIKTVNEDIRSGELLWPSENLKDVLLEAAKYNLRVTIHSNFKANDENLRLFQEVNHSYPIEHLRWGLVHHRFTTPQQMEINKDLHLVLNQDLSFGLISNLTLERKRKKITPHMLYCPIPMYIQKGIPISFDTDGGSASVEQSIWSAVWASTHRELWPDMGGEYSVNRKEALRILTMGGAHRMMMEDKIGSLEHGKFADLAVLSANPLTCPDEQIRDIRSVLTMVDGKIVYKA